MMDEAIELINKLIELYTVQEKNIITRPCERSLEAKVKRRMLKKINILKYIEKILEKQKGEANNG